MFTFSEDHSSRSFRATLDPCPSGYDFRRAKRGEIVPPAGAVYRWKMGSKKPGNIVWTDGLEILVSDDLRHALLPFRGWMSAPIKLLSQTLKPLASYHLFQIHGRCGGFLQQKTCKLPADSTRAWDMYRGLCFEPGEDEPDFCMPRQELDFIFVSDAAAKIIDQMCDNAEVTRCEDMLMDPWVFVAVVEKVGKAQQIAARDARNARA